MKISAKCPLCGNTKIDLFEVYTANGYMGEKPYFVIKCFECGISMEGDDKKQLIGKWNKLCDNHSLCFDKKTAETLYENFVNDLLKAISKTLIKTSMKTNTVNENFKNMANYDPDEYLYREI